MRSTSETSYGARIGNAEKLVAALQNFDNYLPIKPEYSINSYTDLINTTKGLNNTVAEKKQAYSLAVEGRIQVFDKRPWAINKILSPINSTIKGIYGRTGKESTDVAAIIAKIRGANSKNTMSSNSSEDTISQSYQSYNSRAQYFADLIVNLTNFGIDYEPTNAKLAVPALNDLYNEAITSNALVMDTYTKFAQNNASRIDSYYTLSQTAIRIKDCVKAQYGNNSTEYLLIKGLRI